MKKRFDFPAILACSLGGTALQLLAGAGAASATGAALGAVAGPLGIVAGALAGLGFNRLAAWWDKRVEARNAFTDLLTNKDITNNQAHFLQARITVFANTLKGTGQDREACIPMFLAMAQAAPNWWQVLVTDPARVELDAVRDKQAVEQLTSYLAEGKQTMLDTRTWRQVVDAANASVNGDLRIEHNALLNELAVHLEHTFKHDWVEGLKNDLQHDGKAYAAVSLRFFAEILSEVKKGQGLDAESKALLDQLPQLLAQLDTAAKALSAQNLLPEIRATVDRGTTTIAALLAEQTAEINAHTSKEADRVVHSIMDPAHIRMVLLREAKKTYNKKLEQIAIVEDWKERARLEQGEKMLLAEREAKVELMLTSIISDDRSLNASPVDREMNRILNEQGVDEAIAYFIHCNGAVIETAVLKKRVKEGLDGMLEREIRQELQPKLKTAQLLELQSKFDEAQAHYKEILVIDPHWPEAQQGLFWLLIARADDMVVHGTLAQRSQVLLEALGQAKARVQADEKDAQAQRDLSVSYERLGEVAAAQGQLPEAHGHYTKGLGIAERLAAQDPTNTQAQRDLSVSYNKLGEVAAAQGQLPEAHGHYTEGLAIRERLAAQDPTNTQAQRDWYVSHGNLGDVAAAQGQLSEAHGHYTKGLEIAERLAAQDPTNTQAQRDLSISYNKLGNVAAAQGQLPEAHGHYIKGLQICERLAAQDPTNTQAQRDLSYTYFQLSKLLDKMKEKTGALRYAKASLEVDEKLNALDPTNRTWQKDVAASKAWLRRLEG